jgi:ArsR family metal-binding transcriptional regulator
VYDAAVPSLRWTKGGHYIAFQPYQIAVSNVEDREAAIKEVEGLVKLVNRTWERRAEITPDYETHQRPTPLAIYRLLPGTNCRRCGQPTCWSFALKLVAAQVRLAECLPLAEPQYADRLARLQGLVTDAPAIG